MSNDYEQRLLAANSDLSRNIISLREAIVAVCEQRQHEHQDDWDDTLFAAARKIHDAEFHVHRALDILREGS